MATAYVVFTFLTGLYLAYAWSSNSIGNIIIKMMFTVQAMWGGLILLAYVWNQVQAGAMRLF